MKKPPLFSAFFIVSNNKTIVAKYPNNIEPSLLQSIPNFCYPDGWQLTFTEELNSFTFTLQSQSGARMYGNCHHVIDEATKEHDCFCILSHYPYFTMLNDILLICFMRRSCDGMQDVFSFLSKLLENPFPLPGEKFPIISKSNSSFLDPIYHLTRPDDDYMSFADVDVRVLFSIFDTQQILQLFHAALCEQRIVLVGDSVNLVSQSCHSLCALLYPFSWQHIYIPVLPAKLLTYTCAPMPFIVGIHSSMMNELCSLPTENLVIVDLSNATLRMHFSTFSNSSSPVSPSDKPFNLDYNPHLFDQLHQSIESVKSVYEKNERKARVQTYTEALLDKFLDFLVGIFGKYRMYCRPPNYHVDMDVLQEDVLKSLPQKDQNDMLRVRALKDLFLHMRGSQLLEMFLIERTKLYNTHGRNLPGGEFELRCSKLIPAAYGLVQVSESERKPTTSDKRDKKLKSSSSYPNLERSSSTSSSGSSSSGSIFSSLKTKIFGSSSKKPVKISAPKVSPEFERQPSSGLIRMKSYSETDTSEFGAGQSLLAVDSEEMTSSSHQIDQILHLNDSDVLHKSADHPALSFAAHHQMFAPVGEQTLISFSPDSFHTKSQTLPLKQTSTASVNLLDFFDSTPPLPVQIQQPQQSLIDFTEPDLFADDLLFIQTRNVPTANDTFDPFASPQKQSVVTYDDPFGDGPF